MTVYPGKQFFEAGFSVEENFHVIRVVEVFNQRRIRKHCLEEAPHGVVSGSSAVTASLRAKKPLKDIIGALRANRYFSCRRLDINGIGEQLVT